MISSKRTAIPVILFFTMGIITGYAMHKTRSEAVFANSFPAEIIIDAGHGEPEICFKWKV